ncbi:hypothetical protein [Shimazuella kribbensis]|uniref:hypothetical protein n=1 Tax=Shimazuella kribbensis TaxID=139808 RepID=UPI000560DEF7|nr:hypothetical protein [Shimazuella kribbensis]
MYQNRFYNRPFCYRDTSDSLQELPAARIIARVQNGEIIGLPPYRPMLPILYVVRWDVYTLAKKQNRPDVCTPSLTEGVEENHAGRHVYLETKFLK